MAAATRLAMLARARLERCKFTWPATNSVCCWSLRRSAIKCAQCALLLWPTAGREAERRKHIHSMKLILHDRHFAACFLQQTHSNVASRLETTTCVVTGNEAFRVRTQRNAAAKSEAQMSEKPAGESEEKVVINGQSSRGRLHPGG